MKTEAQTLGLFQKLLGKTPGRSESYKAIPLEPSLEELRFAREWLERSERAGIHVTADLRALLTARLARAPMGSRGPQPLGMFLRQQLHVALGFLALEDDQDVRTKIEDDLEAMVGDRPNLEPRPESLKALRRDDGKSNRTLQRAAFIQYMTERANQLLHEKRVALRYSCVEQDGGGTKDSGVAGAGYGHQPPIWLLLDPRVALELQKSQILRLHRSQSTSTDAVQDLEVARRHVRFPGLDQVSGGRTKASTPASERSS